MSDLKGGETSIRVRGAAAGAEADRSWVVERFTPLLVTNAAYRMGCGLRSWCEPEDVVAETWAVALPRMGSLPARDGRLTPVLLRFLTTTLNHVLANLHRKHERRGGGATVPQRLADGATSTLAGDPPDPATGVVPRAERREERDLVLAALAGLSADDRAVVVLRGIEQVTNEAAAAALGVTPSAANMRYARALARLREKLPGSVFAELRDAD